jgi:MFS superfamily sulfate permease-like transporter
MTRSLVGRDRLVAGVAAGIVAGITVAAFAAFSEWSTGASPAATYTFLASLIVGQAAAAGGASWVVPLGIAGLFAGSIAWAFGYLYAARRQPQLLTRPLISGIGFGIIVWFVNQLVLVTMNRFTPTFYGLDRDLIAYVIFFGVPLAFTAARLLRAR